jgi:hypothetical protein
MDVVSSPPLRRSNDRRFFLRKARGTTCQSDDASSLIAGTLPAHTNTATTGLDYAE